MSRCLTHIPLSVKTPAVLQSFIVSSLFHTLLQENISRFENWRVACLSSPQFQLAPQGTGAKLSNYFRAHTARHTKLSASLIRHARDATFLVLASDQRTLGRVKSFMKLTFLEIELLCLYLAGKLLHLHSSIASFSSSTTELKLINKVGWPPCQFSYGFFKSILQLAIC